MSLADLSPLAEPAKRRRPRGAKVLLFTGLVLVLVAVVGGRAGLHRAQGAADDIREDADDVRAGFLAEIPIPGHQGVELEPGTYTVYAVRSYDTTFRTTLPGSPVTDGTATTDPDDDDDPDVDVEVTGPGGRSVVTSTPGLDAILSGLSGDFYGIVDFEATTRGTYDIAGSGTGARQIAVGPARPNGNVSRFIAGGLFAALGFLVGGIGFILAVAGGIWLLVAGDGAPKPGPGGLLPPGPAGWGGAPGRGQAPPWGPPPGTHPPAADPAAAWGQRAGWAPPPQPWAPGHPGPWGARPPGIDPRPPPPAPPPPPPSSPSGDPVVDRQQAAAERSRPAPWGDSPPVADEPPPWSDRR